MGKKKGYETTSENWNVADSYSKIKIMKLLMEIDEYIKVAKTGVAELADEFVLSPTMKVSARVMALNRLHMTIEMLINNSSFGVKKNDKKLLEDWYNALKKINLTLTYNYTTDRDGRKAQAIKEGEFSIVLNTLIDIHRKILVPLNEAGLIFPSGEEEWEPDWDLSN